MTEKLEPLARLGVRRLYFVSVQVLSFSTLFIPRNLFFQIKDFVTYLFVADFFLDSINLT